MPTRRTLIKTLTAAGIAATLPRALRAAPNLTREPVTPTDPLRGVGVQLYTLRAQMQADPDGTIARIAQLGFQEIEWWGQWGRTPAQLRALLDRHGLTAPAAHVDPRDLAPDRIAATLDTAAVMGHTHLIVAWTPPNARTPDDIARLAALLNRAGADGRSRGIRTGYHNHEFEFVQTPQGTLWDIMLRETDPAVVDLELDCYWSFMAGHDPIAMLRRHGDRITHLHLKDSAGPPAHRQADVGAGVIDWGALLREATARRVRHVFVEHDNPADAWATVAAGRRHLTQLGY